MSRSIFDIEDMDVTQYLLKEGDIKVDAAELKKFFEVFESIFSIARDVMEKADKESSVSDLKESWEFFEYMRNKYLLLGHYRRSQKQWYDILQLFNDDQFCIKSKATSEELDEMRREVWGFYQEAKTKRENIQKEVDYLRCEKYSQKI